MDKETPTPGPPGHANAAPAQPNQQGQRFPIVVDGHGPAARAPIPPSVQKVLVALQHRGPLTNAQIRDATNLPRRTVYAALQRLKQEGLLHERVSLKDTRQTYFWVDAPAPMAGEGVEAGA